MKGFSSFQLFQGASKLQGLISEQEGAMDKYSTAVAGDSRFKHVLSDPRFKVNSIQ